MAINTGPCSRLDILRAQRILRTTFNRHFVKDFVGHQPINMLAKMGAVTAGLLLIGLSMDHAHDFRDAVAQARAGGGGKAEEEIAKVDNDNNDEISLDEFKGFLSTHTQKEIEKELELSPKEMQGIAQMADGNRDGNLTEKEANEFYRHNLDINDDHEVDANELNDFERKLDNLTDH